ncbi:MAG: rRNA large subunit methyltransferase I, partial [Clostridia bacterium]|nr:rRNA large subunit methyltransferase I [Clostridia bacterium]
MKAERNYPRYTVTVKAENAILRGHPWVYAEEITDMEGTTENGGLVDVISRKGRYLGTGMISEVSKIRVRLLSRNANDRFDEAFWERKLRWAWEYRKTVLQPQDLDCCRIIFGEADAFPGLTVDRFHDLLSVQVLSVGMELRKDMLLPTLVRILREDGQNIRGV